MTLTRKIITGLVLVAAGLLFALIAQIVSDHARHASAPPVQDSGSEVWWTMALSTPTGPVIIPDGVAYLTHMWK